MKPLHNLIFAFSTVFLLLSLSGITAEDSETPREFLAEAEQFWQRYPVLTVPYLENPPEINGVVDREEWQTAAQLGPLKMDMEGIADDLTREVFVGRDDENLYIAWILERPEEARAPRVPEETGRLRGIRGDLVEINIDMDRSETENRQFLIHANGAFIDAIGRPNADTTWNAEWEQAATLTDTGWQGEVAIPFTVFGLEEAPAPGTVWGFDVVDNRRTPSLSQGHWSYRGPHWHKFANYGYLLFGERPAAVRFLGVGEGEPGRLSVDFEVRKSTDATGDVEATLKLLKRKTGPDGGAASFFANIESGGDDEYDSGDIEFYKGTTLERLIEDTYRFYEPMDGGTLEETVVVEPGQAAQVGFDLPGEPGEYLLEYRFREDGEPLLLGTSVFSILAPLDLQVEPYWLYAEQLEVRTDLRKVDVAPGSILKLVLTPADGGDPFGEQTLSLEAEGSFVNTIFPVKGIEPGDYVLSATMLDSDGGIVETNETLLERPENPEWFRNSHGNKVKVPHPWTPLSATEDGVVEVWNRRYDLGGFFPTTLRAGDSEVLAEAVDFHLEVNGRVQDWKVRSMVLEDSDEAMARYRAELEGEDAILKGTVEIEFDGFAWYEMEIEPKADSFVVDSLYLDIAIVPERAILCGAHRGGVGGHDAGKVIAATGDFTPYQWVGDEEGGIAFIAEGPINWRLENPEEIVALTPASEGNPAKLRIHMIDHKVELDGSLELAFGLQGTPIRKAPVDTVTHVWQVDGPVTDEAYYKNVSEQGATVVCYHAGWKSPGELKQQEFAGWPERPRVASQEARLREAIRLANKHGLKTLLYTGWGVDIGSDEWKHFGPEFIRKPIENSGYNTYRQSAGLQGAYADYMAWAWADLIEEYGMDGVLWDSTANFLPDENIGIGNGYYDENGVLQPTYPVRATRELFRRVYTLVHGEIRNDGVILNHPGSIWAINAFSDIHHRGEGIPMHSRKLRQAWEPLEVYRANYSGKPFGLAALGMNKNYRRLPMMMNNQHAVMLLHGDVGKSAGGAFALNEMLIARHNSYERDKMPLPSLWQARHWLPFDGSEKRHYYHEKELPVDLQPETLLSSVFQSNDGQRALVVVSNLDDFEVSDAKITLDLKALGMNGSGTLHAEDAITKETIHTEDGVFHLDIEPERFRLIKVWSE